VSFTPDRIEGPSASKPGRALLLLACALPLLAGACGTRRPGPGKEPGGRTVILSSETTDEGAPEVPAERQERRRVVLSSEYDDERVGEEAAKGVRAEMGFVEDPELSAYVNDLGARLAGHAPPRSFGYRFAIVDQFEPNAFALPGGHVYVSRGLLALANTPDELANVIGHEIAHAANRHAAAQQETQRRQNPFVMPYVRMAHLAAASRDLERNADEGGQTMAARAGFDPIGMTEFLQHLDQVERIRRGHSRLPSFFDTHPGSTERAAVCAARASELSWTPAPGIGHDRSDHLSRIDGIVLGTNPAEGVFQGSRFLHPDMDFHVRFPKGWRPVNTHRAVGATAPRRDATIFIVAERGESDPKKAAEALVEKHRDTLKIEVTSAKPLRIGDLEAYRLEARGYVDGRHLAGQLTFIPYRGLMYRIVGVAPVNVASRYHPFAHSTARSFRPLTDEERSSIRVLRLRAVEARAGENLVTLSQRTGNAWDPTRTSVLNGLPASTLLDEGALVKVVEEEAYRPKPPPAKP
jgi:predicted Zn-dependent protease